jgi:hypothetical protein
MNEQKSMKKSSKSTKAQIFKALRIQSHTNSIIFFVILVFIDTLVRAVISFITPAMEGHAVSPPLASAQSVPFSVPVSLARAVSQPGGC